MENVVVVVFSNEVQVRQGEEALWQLDRQGNITIHGFAVVERHGDGTAAVKEVEYPRFVGSVMTAKPENRISTSGTPTALAARVAAAMAAPFMAEADNAAAESFIDDVTGVLLPGRMAVVAEIEEEWPTTVDTRMESVGGIVFRWELSDVKRLMTRPGELES
jgi:uncharacterized membrane protein